MKRFVVLVQAIALLSGFVFSAGAADEKVATVKVALIGDSTVTDTAGWGKAFAQRFSDSVAVTNFAMGGRSAKSWYEEDRLPAVLEMKPDYVFIQFGHNGQPGKGPKRETDPATTYRQFLKIYIDQVRANGGRPILVSPVTRRQFTEDGKLFSTLTPWADAAKAVAEETGTPFIDLHTLSMAYHQRVGPEKSVEFAPKEGDYTHFNETGAKVVAGMIVEALREVVPELAELLVK